MSHAARPGPRRDRPLGPVGRCAARSFGPV